MLNLRFVMLVGLTAAAIGACQAPPDGSEEASGQLFTGPCLKPDACLGFPAGTQCHEYDALVGGKKMRAAVCLPEDKIVYRSHTCKDVNPCDCVDVVAQCQPTQICAPLLGDTEMNKVQCFTPLPQSAPAPDDKGPGGSPPGSGPGPKNNPGPKNDPGPVKGSEGELCPAGDLPDTADTRPKHDTAKMEPRPTPPPAPGPSGPPPGPPAPAEEAACMCDPRTDPAGSACAKCPTCTGGTACQLVEDNRGQAIAKCLPKSKAPTTGGPMTGGPTTGGPMTGGPMTGGPTTGGPTTGGPTTGGPMTGGPMTGGPMTGGAPPAGATKILICLAGSKDARCSVCSKCVDACLLDRGKQPECVTAPEAEKRRALKREAFELAAR